MRHSTKVCTINGKKNTDALARRNPRYSGGVSDVWQRKSAGSTRMGNRRGCALGRTPNMVALELAALADARLEQSIVDWDDAVDREWAYEMALDHVDRQWISHCNPLKAKVVVSDAVLGECLPVLMEAFADAVCVHILNARYEQERKELDELEDMIERMKEASGFYGSW